MGSRVPSFRSGLSSIQWGALSRGLEEPGRGPRVFFAFFYCIGAVKRFADVERVCGGARGCGGFAEGF